MPDWNTLQLGGEFVVIDSAYLPFDRHYAAFSCEDATGKELAKITIHDVTKIESALLVKTEEIFRTGTWRLLRTDSGFAVVGLAFQPSQVTWVAFCNDLFSQCEVWRVPAQWGEVVVGPQDIVDPVFTTLLRLIIMHRMLVVANTLIVHSAGVRIGGSVYLFPGYSGAGKSTLCKLFRNHPDAEILSDDRILVRADGMGWSLWGTPWPGELQIAKNTSGPLGGICFLRKSPQSELAPLSPADALERLLPTVSIPWYDAELTGRALDLCGRLVAENPVYDFHSRADQSAVDVLMALARQ